jgi:sterol desaturase/sphingolipid hydroxylase (fatty acid hydroxylase superfamily)
MSRNMAPGRWGAFTPLAGGRDGAFFRITPTYVDLNLPPGFSPKGTPQLSAMLINALTLRHLWASPYAIWFTVAVVLNWLAPYDLSLGGSAAASPVSLAFFLARFPSLLTVTIAYYSFWHCALYFWDWAARTFVRGRVYVWAKTLHNAALTIVGVAMWVACENVMCHLWATDRLRSALDSLTLSKPVDMALATGFLAFMPVWRASHFFVNHRFIHFPAMYAHIHRLHHRNADPDVFAGLAMHPVEQLWFFAGAMPFLWVPLPPFLFFFMGMCFLLSPAGGHSGWEDVMQSDVHHYLHHRELLEELRCPHMLGLLVRLVADSHPFVFVLQ